MIECELGNGLSPTATPASPHLQLSQDNCIDCTDLMMFINLEGPAGPVPDACSLSGLSANAAGGMSTYVGYMVYSAAASTVATNLVGT